MFYLGHTMGIPKNDADLGGGQPLLGQLEDLILDLVAGHLHPLGDGAPVRQSRLGDTLARSVHATHFSAVVVLLKHHKMTMVMRLRESRMILLYLDLI